jgi:hypothetical protein
MGGNARKVVFMIDASGSLIDTMPFVIAALKESIAKLSEEQQFTVLFFQGSRVIEAGGAGLKKATFDNRRRVTQWLDPEQGNVVPGGGAQPLDAFKVALAYRPDLIFVLSDDITGTRSHQIDQRELLAGLEQIRQTSPRTRINTIQFLYPDQLTYTGRKGTLEMISLLSGGVYKFLDGKELGIQ